MSYSRTDLSFASQLVNDLIARGFDAYLDKKDILPGEPWKERLGALIVGADTIIFLISPDSMVSTHCGWEADEAVRLSKRILPVVYRPVPDDEVPGRIKRLNYIFMRDVDDRTTALDILATAIEINIQWIRHHTRIAEAAAQWADPDAGGDDSLLHGREISDAERWISSRPANAPEPTELQRAFILRSRERETARSEAEKEQIAKTRRFQRRASWGLTGIGVLVAMGFAAAIVQTRLAAEQTASVLTSLATKEIERGFYDRAMRLAVHGLPPQSAVPWINPWSTELEAKLAGAATMSRLLQTLHDKYSYRAPRFSPAGHRFITTTALETQLWDSKSGKLVSTIHGKDGHFSSNGLLIITQDECDIRLWDGATGREIRNLETKCSAHDYFPLSVDGWRYRALLTEDGARVFAAEGTAGLLLWNLGDGAAIVIRGAEGTALTGYPSPDGKRIATLSDDRSPYLWNAMTGTLIAPLPIEEKGLVTLKFSPDGARILTTGDRHAVRLWNAEDGSQIAVLAGQSAFFSPDSKRVVTFGGSKAQVWNSGRGTEIATLKEGDERIREIYFSRDGSHILTSHDSGQAVVWAADGAKVRNVGTHGHNLRCMAFSSSLTRAVMSDGNGGAYLWNGEGGGLIATLLGHSGDARCIFSPDETRLLTFADDKGPMIWDAWRGTLLAVLNGHESRVESAVFSPDGSQILTKTSAQVVRRWDARMGSEMVTIKAPGPAIKSLLNRDATVLLIAASDGSTTLSDAASGTKIATLSGHSVQASGAFSADGSRLLTYDDGGTWLLWDGRSGSLIANHARHKMQRMVAFNSVGSRILSIASDWRPHLWDAQSGLEIALEGADNLVIDGRFSSDGQRLVLTSQQTKLFDGRSGRMIADLADAISAAFSPDGELLVTSRGDHTVVIWDGRRGTRLGILRNGHLGAVEGAQFTPDGKRIVTNSVHDAPVLWDVHSATKLSPLGEDTGHSVLISPDGRQIATVYNDEAVALWSADTGGKIADLRKEGRPTRGVPVFSSDGKRLFLRSGATGHLFDAQQGMEIARLDGHTQEINGVAFSPDGRRIATAANDNTVRLWDSETGTAIAVLGAHEDRVEGVLFNSDGRRLITSARDGSVKIWEISWTELQGKDLRSRICAEKLPGAQEFTDEELKEPVLSALRWNGDRNPCLHNGALSPQYYAQALDRLRLSIGGLVK